HLKVAIIVSASLLAGAVITVGIQHCLPTQQHEQAEQAAVSPDPNGEQSESAPAQAEAVPAAPSGLQPVSSGLASASGAKPPTPVESPYPVSSALAVLNNGSAQVAAPGSPVVIVQPGQQFSQSTSGYPIFTGGRAIDSTAAVQGQFVQQGSGPIIIQTQSQD